MNLRRVDSISSGMGIEGIAELPLHDGHVPPWLLVYMKKLGKAIVEYIVDEFGPSELVRRLSDPFWFQAFNNVIGMDWDSSGSTTVVIYVLKSFANVDTFKDIGFAVLGGKGSDARKVLEELAKLSRYSNLDTHVLEYVSRLSAKIDSVALQDGYTLYIHSLIVSEDGLWTVIQQGMNLEIKMARRYHIHGVGRSITVEKDPHSGIACNKMHRVLNLVDEESKDSRRAILDIVSDTEPRKIVEYLHTVNRVLRRVGSLTRWMKSSTKRDESIDEKSLQVRASLNPRFYRPITDINRIEMVLKKLYEYKPRTFEEMLALRGLGPEAIRALALIADVIYNARPSFRDPVTHPIDPFIYAYAHGGKDGIPFPVRPDLMRQSIEFLRRAIEESKLEEKYRRQALRRLARYIASVVESVNQRESN